MRTNLSKKLDILCNEAIEILNNNPHRFMRNDYDAGFIFGYSALHTHDNLLGIMNGELLVIDYEKDEKGFYKDVHVVVPIETDWYLYLQPDTLLTIADAVKENVFDNVPC